MAVMEVEAGWHRRRRRESQPDGQWEQTWRQAVRPGSRRAARQDRAAHEATGHGAAVHGGGEAAGLQVGMHERVWLQPRLHRQEGGYYGGRASRLMTTPAKSAPPSGRRDT